MLITIPKAGPDDYFIKCPQCQKGYPGFQALKEHVEAAHPVPDSQGGAPASPLGGPPSPGPVVGPGGSYACSQCSASFLNKDQLEKHELLHSPNAQVVKEADAFPRVSTDVPLTRAWKGGRQEGPILYKPFIG
uniref:C2H2-type domain-containing protein n=1 Tax=Timema monikensis TaxID=170555 RepID=A0A7R9DXV0_9NEOP|nr:unnamed protein product [Timema monikensis]